MSIIKSVRCGSLKGYINFDKFGSGSNGYCIRIKGTEGHVTPNQFEAKSDLKASFKWKNSIR